MKLALLLVYLSLHTSAANICTTCKCKNEEKTSTVKILDCTRLSLDKVPMNSEWPISDNSTISTIADFEFNNFKTIEQFPILKSIVALCFRHNQINKMAASAFENLSNLKKLDLSHNELAGDAIRADVFRGGFDNVRYEPLGIVSLNLGYNQIHSLNSKAFEHLPDMVELRLNNNPLAVIDGTTEMALSVPKSLVILDLGSTGLATLPEHFTRSLRAVQELNLNGNNFDQVPLSLAAVGATLKRLNLNDNPILRLDSDSFLGLRRLEELNVSGCKHLREVLPYTFSQLERLDTLHLSFNFNLTYIDRDAFAAILEFWPIKQLYLHHNALSWLHPDLVPWDKLDLLDLQENPWRCDCQLGWMVTGIVPRIAKGDPDRVLDIRCDEPSQLKGIQLLAVDTTTLSNTSCNSPTQPRQSPGVKLNPLIIAILLLACLVIVSAMLLLFRTRCVVNTSTRFVRLRNTAI